MRYLVTGQNCSISAVIMTISLVASAIIVWDHYFAFCTVGFIVLLIFFSLKSIQPPKIFLVSLGILLTGYVLLGKGFAYIGYPPIFVSEIVLFLGLLSVVYGGQLNFALRSPISWIIIIYVLWGAFCSVPYLGTFGLST